MSKEKTDHNALPLQHTVSIPGWTKEDKLKLYTALKEFGSNNIAHLTDYLQKSPTEVKQAIEIYKKRAKACKASEKTRVAPVKAENCDIPLDNWARMLMTNSSPEQLQCETANAVKLIAELENFPKPNFAENINFKNIYLTIADAIEGKPLKPNSLAQHMIHRCMVDTAYFSKNIAKRVQVSNILEKAVNLKPDTDTDFYFQYTDDLETTIMRKLIHIDAYNPLNIPIEALKCTLAQESRQFSND